MKKKKLHSILVGTLFKIYGMQLVLEIYSKG